MSRFLIISTLLLLSCFTHVVSANSNKTLLNQINVIRQEARMTPLAYSKALTQASQNHANYLSRHVSGPSKVNLHAEKKALAGFSGEHAWERAQRIGYPSKSVKENISAGNQDGESSLDGLMSGIYHRFTFLDFLIDTIGYGVASGRSDYNSYVYNMGRKDMEKLCSQRPKHATPQKGFDCLGTIVNADYMKKACAVIPAEAIYQAPYPIRCTNGKLLQSRYMDNICRTQPAEIKLRGHGSYLEICEPTIKVSADWFEKTCRSNDRSIIHNGETRYYEMCDKKKRVYESWFKNYCQAASSTDQNMDASSYLQLCNSDFKVNKQHSDQLDQQHFKRNPDYVIWPSAGAREVTPVFFEEEPDPLPDLSVSGYPLSLHFNPGKVKTISLRNFKLEKVINNKTSLKIKNIREINQKTDPQKNFTKLQFAWFPLQRLDWNSFYRASVTATINGRQREIRWAFKTKSVAEPILTIAPQQSTVTVPEGKWFTLYFAPNKRVPHPLKNINLSWLGVGKAESDIIDSNTVQVRFNHTACQAFYLTMSQGRKLLLNSCAR